MPFVQERMPATAQQNASRAYAAAKSGSASWPKGEEAREVPPASHALDRQQTGNDLTEEQLADRRQKGMAAQEKCYRLMPEFVDVMKGLHACFDTPWSALEITEMSSGGDEPPPPLSRLDKGEEGSQHPC